MFSAAQKKKIFKCFKMHVWACCVCVVAREKRDESRKKEKKSYQTFLYYAHSLSRNEFFFGNAFLGVQRRNVA